MSATLVKICGITRVEDAAVAVDLGADWLGLNFWPGSPRCVDRARARAIATAARQRVEARYGWEPRSDELHGMLTEASARRARRA